MNDRMLIEIPQDGQYIEILGHRIDGFKSFEAFCEHLNKFAEMEETIKSQKAEIERLKEENLNFADIGKMYSEIRDEAVKEFAERLKEKEDLIELVEHLNKYEHCKKCIHLTACDAWVRHGERIYDDFTYSVEACPYFKEMVGDEK